MWSFQSVYVAPFAVLSATAPAAGPDAGSPPAKQRVIDSFRGPELHAYTTPQSFSGAVSPELLAQKLSPLMSI